MIYTYTQNTICKPIAIKPVTIPVIAIPLPKGFFKPTKPKITPKIAKIIDRKPRNGIIINTNERIPTTKAAIPIPLVGCFGAY